MSLFDFILSLLLVFNPSMPESTFDQVYSILDDTQIRSVLVNDSAVEALAELAGNAEIMPLEFGQSDSATLNSILDMLYTNGQPYNSVAYWSQTINHNLVNFRNDLSSFPDAFKEHALKTSQIYDFLTNGNQYTGLVGLLSASNKNTEFTWKYLEKISGQLTESSGGWDKPFTVPFFDLNSFSFTSPAMSPVSLLADFRNIFAQNCLLIYDGWYGLQSDGKIGLISRGTSLFGLVSNGFSGLSNLMSGSDRSTTFSFLREDLSGSDDLMANNLLDAFGLVGTQLQNPLQRLAYVLANPQDIQIREDVSANVDQAQQDFFKGDGGGSVKPDDIKDAAGISGGAAGALESPGSVGDLTAQINNQDNFSFFSDVTLGNLDSVPATHSEDDDFIDFYDPSNPALWEALSDEPVS